jgi:hypothetical protein
MWSLYRARSKFVKKMTTKWRQVETEEEISCRGGFDLTRPPWGLGLYAGLKILNISNNKLSRVTLPPLPPRLEQFYCKRCYLREIPEYPDSLVVLDCRWNPYYDEYLSQKFPLGLRELYICGWESHWEIKISQLVNLEVLSWNFPDVDEAYQLPRGLRVLKLAGSNKPIEALLRDLPSGLISLEISSIGISKIEKLPPGLIYLSLCGVAELPKLPDGLEALELQNFGRNVVLAGLPRGLRTLDVRNSVLRLGDEELPPGLTYLRYKCRATKFPRLPDGLEYVDVGESEQTEELEIPSRVKFLNCARSSIAGVTWRDGIMPPLLVFNCSEAKIRRMPPLPRVMFQVDIERVKFDEPWRGNFDYIGELIWRDCELAGLPDIARAEAVLGLPGGRMRVMPECVNVASLFSMDGRVFGEDEIQQLREEVEVDPVGLSEVPSLLELAGLEVVAHGLGGEVKVAELQEYLERFDWCPECSRRAILHRRWEFGVMPISRLRCWRCPGGKLPKFGIDAEIAEASRWPKFRRNYLAGLTIKGAHKARGAQR